MLGCARRQVNEEDSQRAKSRLKRKYLTVLPTSEGQTVPGAPVCRESLPLLLRAVSPVVYYLDALSWLG
jgi:hypothetical protein